MTRQFFAGGWYVDALPSFHSGEFAVLYPGSHIQSHIGRIELPGDEPLYLRITNIGVFKFAGQAHNSARTLEWDGAWHDRPVACGVSPVIYDGFGQLLISQCGPVGSQGYRYVNAADGRVITGDQTYGSSFGLSEWSEYAGLYIGQGHDSGGCLVWDGLVLRVLEPGDCRFIRVQGSHEAVAISFVKPDGAVIIQTTVQELRALPVFVAPVPVPQPVPVPTPTPEPVPSMPVQNRATELAAFHQQFNGRQPITDDAVKHVFTEGLAGYLNQQDGSLRWGRKARAGTDAKSKDTLGYWLGPLVPHNATDGKVDAFDVVASTGAVSWDLRAEQNDPGYRSIDARWFPVTAASVPNPGTTVPNPGTPSAPTVDLSAVLAKLDALTTLLMDLRAATETIALDVEDLQHRASQPATFPKYSGTAKLGTTMRFTLEPQK
jgi:hypothetical protein